MKKLFAKVTAAISAAAMLAVPTINAFPANASVVNYTRYIWKEYNGIDDWWWEQNIGDANGDGIVNLDDATAVLDYIGDKDHHTVIKYKADANGDGAITAIDALIIQRVVKGYTFFEREQVYLQDYIEKGIYNANGTYRLFDFRHSYQAVLLGDINNDGLINDADIDSFDEAMKSSKHLHIFDGGLNGNDFVRARRAGDINNNGEFDQEDLELLETVVSGQHINFDFILD